MVTEKDTGSQKEQTPGNVSTTHPAPAPNLYSKGMGGRGEGEPLTDLWFD